MGASVTRICRLGDRRAKPNTPTSSQNGLSAMPLVFQTVWRAKVKTLQGASKNDPFGMKLGV
jgi:hypothetical protein